MGGCSLLPHEFLCVDLASGDSLGNLKDLIGKWQRETWKFVLSRMLEYRIGVNQEVSETWPRISDFPKANPAMSNDWVPLSEYKPPKPPRPGASPPPPVAIRFWNGKQKELKLWNEILTGVAEQLRREDRLTARMCPIRFERHKLYSVHTEPVHPSGKEFENPNQIEGDPPLFVNVKLPIGQHVKNTQFLLEHCGVEPAKVCLRVTR